MMRVPSAAFALASLLALCACGEAVPRHRLVELPSGRHVKLIEVRDVRLEDGAPALSIRYETDLEPDAGEALLAEARSNFEAFRAQAEALGRDTVLVHAVLADGPGWQLDRGSLAFVLDRTDDGSWRFRSQTAPRAPGTERPAGGDPRLAGLR